MKKIACIVLAVLVTAGIVFAGGSSEPAKKEAAPQVVKLKWAHVYEVNEEYHKWALWAAEEIKKKTNGVYQIDVFPASSLGKESDIVQALSLGSVDMVYAGTAFIGNTYGPIALSEAPFVFENFKHWQNFSNSTFFDELAEGYNKASKGNKITAITYYGARCVTSKKPINKPEDMKGLKIRVPNAPLYLMFTEAVGANAAPIAFAEVYLALQQNVVDAQENPLPTIQAKKFYEVQKYINLTQHIVNNLATIISAQTWNKLSPENQKIFTDVTKEAAEKCSLAINKAEDDLLPWFEQQGNIVNRLDRTPFIQAVAPSLKNSPRMTWTLEHYNKMMALK
ncbi:MAG TPA: sialic acid TRAP transporter substrate-binding protein SiaP [Spirochaetales bacterium]|nr:sialic acid TRAP transporter substrate-binding protein SiaP [Spirochaetales bacterium]HOV38045.1 sialic acid TRAP transporter substrate-binding protein SiaP [Spirochaetales bacterium]